VDFTSYGAVKRWTSNFKTSIETETMPPWPAKAMDVCFSNANALTQQEKDILLEWASNRFPRGEGAYTVPDSFQGEWILGEPDAILTVPDHTLGEDETYVSREFTIETDFPEDKWIVATEIILEDPYMTHRVEGGVLGFYYPGNPAQEWPAGVAAKLPAGESVTVTVYYRKEAGYESSDATRFGLHFADDPTAIEREVRFARVSNDDFTVPANEGAHAVGAKQPFLFEAEILSFLPSMHERGGSIVCTVKTGDAEHKLLNIPKWQARWRYTYILAEPVAVAPGSLFEVAATFNNASLNVDNPDPDVAVPAALDGEELVCWIGYTVPAK